MALDSPSFDERARALAEGHNEALALAVATRPLVDVLEALALTAQRHAGGSSYASILLVDGSTQQLVFGAAPTLPAAFSAAIDRLPIGPDVGACGAAAFSGEPVVVPDVATDPRMRDFLALAREHGIQSCWSMPIRSPKGVVLGTFALYRTEVHTPDDAERNGIAQLANTAALVLDREQETLRRQHAERALAAARDRVDALLTAAEVATWSWDVVADQVTADPLLRQLFSVSDADASDGRLATYVRAIHPDDVGRVSALIERALHSGEVYEATYRVRHQDGNYRHVIARGRAEFGDGGQAKRLSGVVIDVTAKTHAESRLLISEQRYRTLFESIDEGFCIIDVIHDAAGRPCDYRFVETNPAFVQHTGLTGAVGRTMREMVPGHESHCLEIYERVASSGEPVRFIDRAEALDRWYDVYAMRLGNTGARVAVLLNDISSQKHAEDELRRLAAELAAADRRKDEFLAMLGHELRNPLAPLRNGLEIMRIAADSPVTVAKARDMMERQLGNVVRLVNDLLDVARVGSGKLQIKREPVSLQAVIASAVETSMPLIEANRHELSIEMDDVQSLMLDVDPTRIAQAISNLLINAAKFTPAGGRIRIAASASSIELQIAVIDTGFGIAPQSIPGLFTMFAQVDRHTGQSHGGLGIGLALVRRLMELHGGSVAAASAGEGCGSTFTLRLPLPSAVTGIETAIPAPPAEQARQGSGLRVLIADDNRDAADSLAVSLQLVGHLTAVAYDGLQALELASGFVPEAAVVDIGMPGLDGYGVARALRSLPATRGIALVALTGRGAANDRAMALEAGFDRHLTKPGEPKDIEALLVNIASDRSRDNSAACSGSNLRRRKDDA